VLGLLLASARGTWLDHPMKIVIVSVWPNTRSTVRDNASCLRRAIACPMRDMACLRRARGSIGEEAGTGPDLAFGQNCTSFTSLLTEASASKIPTAAATSHVTF